MKRRTFLSRIGLGVAAIGAASLGVFPKAKIWWETRLQWMARKYPDSPAMQILARMERDGTLRRETTPYGEFLFLDFPWLKSNDKR
jgi:hypothetical protein